jgi:hypothetical protein
MHTVQVQSNRVVVVYRNLGLLCELILLRDINLSVFQPPVRHLVKAEIETLIDYLCTK